MRRRRRFALAGCRLFIHRLKCPRPAPDYAQKAAAAAAPFELLGAHANH
jgi:hypothetical protein